jgi:uncharacterized protein YutE (UPF0331/DUF86 family)
MTPGALDPSVVGRHLSALDDVLQVLQRHRGVTAEELEADRERRWIVERGLQLCAQSVLDVATHIAASSGRQTPDYCTAIDRLAELDILSEDFTRRFRGIAGFRNVLVHGYLEVDLDEIERLLGDRLDDFVEFSRRVETYLSVQDDTARS